MEATHATAGIRNPVEPNPSGEGLFLVDTGTTECVVPGLHLEVVRLRPKVHRTCKLTGAADA